MSTSDAIDLLIELFGWDGNDPHLRYEALLVLCRAREQAPPTYDDFLANVTR